MTLEIGEDDNTGIFGDKHGGNQSFFHRIVGHFTGENNGGETQRADISPRRLYG